MDDIKLFWDTPATSSAKWESKHIFEKAKAAYQKVVFVYTFTYNGGVMMLYLFGGYSPRSEVKN